MTLTRDNAAVVDYDNTTSGLTATDTNTAIDEVEGRVDTAESDITALEALAIPATATNKGLIEIATQAEVDAGTDTERAVTADTLANFITANTKLAATNGWWKDGTTGIIVQWGETATINNDSDAWTDSPTAFPMAFPTNCFTVVGVLGGDGTPATDPHFAARKEPSTPLTSFEYYTNALSGTNKIAFIAIGN